MTFEERYSENPEFWSCLDDMSNICIRPIDRVVT